MLGHRTRYHDNDGDSDLNSVSGIHSWNNHHKDLNRPDILNPLGYIFVRLKSELERTSSAG